MKQTLVNEIKADSLDAMMNREKSKLSALRLLIADLEKEKVQLKLAKVEDLSDEIVVSVVNRSIKKLDKEIESYIAVNRDTAKQEAEKELYKNYLPKQLTETEILVAVRLIAENTKASGDKIGQAMKAVSAQLKGKADMKLVSELMKKEMND